MANPRVSVVMPTYNYGCFIGETIDGFLNQTFSDFELIIVDDGSTDHTQDVIGAYRDDRIRLVTREENSGSAVWARNDGMAIAKGEYIAVADADDVSVPDRLERQMSFLKRHAHVDAIGGALLPVDVHGRAIGPPVYKPVFRKRPEQYRLRMLQGETVLVHGTLMFRRLILKKVEGYHFYASGGDTEFILRATRYFTFCNLRQVVIYCRQHSQSTTRTYGAKMKHHYRAITLAQEQLWVERQLKDTYE
ncbi:MAG: glycosyltransferase involved in cell wall biosynthesis [Candidatus Latescibacterota bacterium]|jgi:glycosyltransferase involved in cell wall biosynthesis